MTDELWQKSACELAEGIARRQFSCGEVMASVAERIRANIEQVAFREGPEGRPQRLTVSVGKVSFPHDGHTDSILLSQAMAYLAQAVERGGNQVTHTSGNPE